VLFALNMEWEGGKLEASVDLQHPTTVRSSKKPRPVIGGFCTDNSYSSTTSGHRGTSPFEDDEESLENVARRVQCLDSIITYSNHNDASTQGVIDEIQELHKRGTSMVNFSLYRGASVKRENLK
jgi:hypothetical protein